MASKVHQYTEEEEAKRIEEAEIELEEDKRLIKIADNLYIPQDFEINHNYYADSEGKKPYMGITSVLRVIAKPALIQWAANMVDEHIRANISYAIPGEDGGLWAIKPSVIEEARTAHTKKKEQAGSEGTNVHALIEVLINDAIKNNNGFMDKSEHDIPQVAVFIEWASTNKVRFLASEKRLVSTSLWVAGTADFIAEINGQLMIGDVKTNNSGIYPEHKMQASAYAYMALEMGLYKEFDGIVVINVPKKGGIKIEYSYDLKGNVEAFKNALSLYKFINN